MSTSSVSGSSTVNGLYSNPNQISGLVSGLDTESMIEGLVDSYSNKIITYQQDIVMLQWQQEAYRDVITDLVNFTAKYTSFTSDSNIFSNAFFNGATSSVASGEDSDKVTVSGTSDSNIEITSVLSTASSARLETSALTDTVDANYISGTTADLAGENTVGALDGYMTFTFGNTTVDIEWSQEDMFFGSTDAFLGQEFAEKLNEKLESVSFSVGGVSKPASDRFEAYYNSDTGCVEFKDLTGSGNEVTITAASSSIKEALGLTIKTDEGDGDISFTGANKVGLDTLTKKTTGYSEISGQSINVTYNGTTKSLQLPTIEETIDEVTGSVTGYKIGDQTFDKTEEGLAALNDAIAAEMQTSMDKLFGTGAISVGNASGFTDDDIASVNTFVSGYLGLTSTYTGAIAALDKDSTEYDYDTEFAALTQKYEEDKNAMFANVTDDAKDVAAYMGFDTDEAGMLEFAAYLTETQVVGGESNAELLKSEFNSGKLALSFTINNLGNNTLNINAGTLGKYLGLEENEANYVTTAKELGDLLPDFEFPSNEPIEDELISGIYTQKTPEEGEAYLTSNGSITLSSDESYYYDADGDKVEKVEIEGDNGKEEIWVKLDSSGCHRIGISMVINDVEVGVFDDESSLQDVLDSINSSDAGVMASFSTLTNKIVFTTKETGVGQRIDIEETDLTKALFGSTEDNEDKYTAGTSCVMIAEVNGEEVMLVRDSNAVNIDGLTVTVKETFGNTYEADDGTTVTVDNLEDYALVSDKIEKSSITFTEEIDSDPLVDAISAMVDDYNELMSKLKGYLTDVPLTNSSGTSYKPLTDEDSSSMTESAIESYEEKAKTGILFGDSNIRSLYNSLSTVFSASGSFGGDLYSMGFDVGYNSTLSENMVSLDTDKLKEFMSTKSGVETVRNAFVSSMDAGSSADGVMASLKSKMNQYGAVTGATKGILVEAAGSELSSLSLLSNTMQTKIDAFNKLIEEWEEKLSDKVSYYTSQFTALEVLMSEMNSQASALAGLSSGY